ncbi:hypothetical protein [Bradyrhizobium sp.]|uniref:beta strand repeat-containing protein n=1 Tax=Bradyrhizobium sp. TaxID=376 RepID=UPI00272398CB|nr:hypothetical protein [Bradyrhizobium sp.]MDO9299065.1 hypothetical protein [Bradyrhizobium sp.]
MALTAGSIAFTGFNGDGDDNLSFVALADIAQGTVINFTDSNWNGSSFASGGKAESTMAWTATSAISAGTVININNIGSGTFGASAGTVSFTNSNNTGLSNDGEVVYAYVGPAASPTFLAAISTVGYSSSDGTLSGTGLVAGQTAVSFTGSLDIMGYNGARSGQGSFAAYLAALNNPANWQTQNGSGNQSTDGPAPNAPFPTTAFSVTAPAGQEISFSPASVSVAEGDSGTRTLTFTVLRSGGTTGAVSFSGTFAAGATSAADYGGTLPASTFSGSIAAGASSATVTITISGDTAGEANESFTLALTTATNASAPVTIGTANATGTITNDDGTVVSSNSSAAITLANNDQATILSGVTLSGSTPVTWVGGSTTPGSALDNLGTITGTSRAVYTSGSASGSFAVHNGAGATITAVKDAIKISNLGSGANGTFTLDNEGTISSTGIAGDAGQTLDLDDIASVNVQTVITNAASGVIQAADADAIRAGTNATINNSGQIVSHNGSASSTGNDAIDFQSAHTGGVVNNLAGGVINGARHGVTGDQPIFVRNGQMVAGEGSGNATITGRAGAGINMDTASSTTTDVMNFGTITGTAVNGSDGDGIDVDGLVHIYNHENGIIKAVGLTGVANGLNEALAVGGGAISNFGLIVSDQRAITIDDSNGGSAFGATTITNEGTIQGGNGEAISIAGTFADTVTNSGIVTGSVAMGDGSDTLTNSGTVTGAILMGAGDDSLNLVTGATVTGPLDGGADNDTVNLSGAGAAALLATTGFENLVAQEGTWSVAASDYSSVTIEDGATVTSTVTLNNDDELTIEAGGALINATTMIWTGGGDAVVDNAGLIQASSRVFNTTANAAGSFTLNNQAGGVVRGPLSPQFGAAADATVTINNAGMMESSGRVIDFQSLAAGGADIVINNLEGGTIRQTGSNTDVIRPGQDTVVDNHGTITTAPGFAGGGDLIDYQSSTGGKVNNYATGWMEGARHAVTGDNAVTVYNAGTMIGRNGSAVNIDNGDSEAEKVFVTNHGTMEGRSAALSDSDGDAIDVDGLVQVLNYGRIAGLGANGRHDGEPNVSEGIAIGGGTILNYGANAEIYGYGRAIQVDNSSNSNALGTTFINNDGLIKGDGHGPEGVTLTPEEVAKFDLRGNEAIKLVGDYADEIINGSTGRIVGGVSMGGGNDHLQSMGSFTATGGSAIDMGAGNDTMYLYTGTTVQGTILLGTGDDLVLSTADSGFAIDAGDGDDQMYISGYTGGNDILGGGVGNDVIYAGLGSDQIDGGADNDTLSGEGGDDVVDGGAGDDHIMGGSGVDTLRGGEGNDRIEAGAGDTVEGGADDDVIEVSTWSGVPASIDGGDGDDTLELSGTGSGGLGGATNVEKLVVQGGVWTVLDASNFSEAMVESGATLIAYGNGTDTTVAQGGTHYVWGTATGSAVSGQQIVGPGAAASETAIASGGLQIVHTGGVSNGAIVAGDQAIYGSADQTTIGDGGTQAVYAGGTASGTTVNAGGTQIDWGVVSGTIVNGGTQYVWGTATGTTVVSGLQQVGNGGTADAAIVNGGGEQIVHGGGVSNGAIVAGDQTVYGSADQTTIGDGGLQSVYGSATGTMVEAGGEQSVHVNGVATGTTLNGGVQITWGNAVDTMILSGNQYVWGTASGTTIQSGAQHVGAGGSVSDTTIDSGGIGYVHAGGALHDVTFGSAGGALVLDETDAFSGEISGWDDGDRIALGDIAFGESTTLAYVANAGNTGGLLTVSDGTHVATLELLGQYTAADFALSSNGYGGTMISDPGVAQQNVLAPALAA